MKELRELPEEWINRDLNALLHVSAERKGSQQGFGSESILTKVVQSANPYDIQVNDIGFNNRVVEVVYTPSTSAVSGQGTILSFWYTDSYASPSNAAEVFVDEMGQLGGGIQKFRLYLRGNDSNPPAWGRYKFYFETIGSGNFTASLL